MPRTAKSDSVRRDADVSCRLIVYVDRMCHAGSREVHASVACEAMHPILSVHLSVAICKGEWVSSDDSVSLITNNASYLPRIKQPHTMAAIIVITRHSFKWLIIFAWSFFIADRIFFLLFRYLFLNIQWSSGVKSLKSLIIFYGIQI